MDERLKESISALVDDEANELEIQRVLSNLDDEAVDAWQGYHSIRDSIQGRNPTMPMIDIRQSIADKLDYELDGMDEPVDFDDVVDDVMVENSAPISNSTTQNVDSIDTARSTNGRRAITRRLSKGPIFGVAASALFALVLATQYQGVSQKAQQPAIASADSGLSTSQESLYAQAPVAEAAQVSVRQPKIIDQFSEEHARQFNQYLLRHAEHSVYGFSQGVMPLARVASVNSVGL